MSKLQKAARRSTGYIEFAPIGENGSVLARRRRLAVAASRELTQLKDQEESGMSPAEQVLHRRRLSYAERLEAKDVDSMSTSQLKAHRRRLTHGPGVSPVMASLLEDIVIAHAARYY